MSDPDGSTVRYIRFSRSWNTVCVPAPLVNVARLPRSSYVPIVPIR